MTDKKAFNDAVDHLRKIEGYPSQVNLNKLPKALRYFGYFFLSFFALSGLIILLLLLFT